MLGDLALEDREPERQVDRDPEPGEERRGDDDPGRRKQRQRDQLKRDQRGPEDAGDEREPRAVAQGDDAADHGTHAVPRGDHRPVARTAQVGLRNRRPEHRPEHEEDVAEPEDDDGGPEPRPRREFSPALAQLPEEVRRRRGDSAPRDRDPREDQCRRSKGRSVDRERGPWAPGDDDRPADHRADDEDEVPHESTQGVRLLEVLGTHGLGDEPGLGRDHESVGRPIQDLEADQKPERGMPGEDDGRRRRLRSALPHRRTDEDPVPRKPVGEDAAVQDQHGIRGLAPGEDDPEVERLRRLGQVEDGEGERDIRDRVAERRDRRRREEQAVRPLGERSEPRVQGELRHGR